MRRWIVLLATSLPLLAMLVVQASADWTTITLHPITETNTYAIGVSPGEQVGYTANNITSSRACLWTGDALSYVELHPDGAISSVALGTAGGQQVGYARFQDTEHGAVEHAGAWTGSAGSWVDLNPAGACQSGVWAVCDGQFAGYAEYEGLGRHAVLWPDATTNVVDLHPSVAWSSHAYGVQGGQQVGFVEMDTSRQNHAALWNGSAQSFVDLNPSVTDQSYACAVSDGQQVGVVRYGSYSHASLWTGTAASWVDLTPPNAWNSAANGVSGGRQVGTTDGHAGMWTGTAASWQDLHVLLPAGEYSSSQAFDVYTSGGSTWVVGCAVNANTGKTEAVMWTYTLPIPVTIGAARNAPIPSLIVVTDAVVTATNIESGSVFVESSNRSAGIKLVTEESLSVGQSVQFTGTTGRVDGEYQISGIAFLGIAAGQPLTPVWMAARSIGNDPTECLNYVGLNTTGLLVRMSGQVTGAVPPEQVIYVDDGAGYQCGVGQPVLGMRTHVPAGVILPAAGDHVIITGISRVEKHTLTDWRLVNGVWRSPGTVLYVPSVWARDAGDISAL